MPLKSSKFEQKKETVQLLLLDSLNEVMDTVYYHSKMNCVVP